MRLGDSSGPMKKKGGGGKVGNCSLLWKGRPNRTAQPLWAKTAAIKKD